MYTKQEKKFNTWALRNNDRVHYTFTQSFNYNNNEAKLKMYRSPVIVWKTTRVDYTQRPTETRRNDSIARARERLYDLVSANINQYKEMTTFITLTFADNVTTLEEANPLFRAFIRRLNNLFDLKVKYISVVEFQKRGAVHYHVLFFNLPFFNIHEFENCWGHGYTNVQALHNVRNVSAYVAKYLSKETFDKRLVGQKVFFSSRGLLRSAITRDNIEIESKLPHYRGVGVILSKNLTIEKYERKGIINFRGIQRGRKQKKRKAI